MNISIKKIAVLGVGTAGLTSISHCLTWLPEGCQVYSISDPSTPILGIGESTTVTIPKNLFLGTKFTLFRDSDSLDATVKKGVKYVGWRDHDWHSHILPPNYGIHFNNFKLKEFCFDRFKSIWGDKFQPVYGKISQIENQKDTAVVVMPDAVLEFDYIIDCRGYPEDYTEYEQPTSIAVNHCLVNMIPTPGDWDWTYHVAHRNGWMFGIPLKTRQGWGYLYNDTITEKADAVDDIAERFKTHPKNLELKEFSFKNYYAKKFLDGRILKNGNRALFLEPIEALSGWFYDEVIKNFFDVLYEKSDELTCNARLIRTAEDTVTFVSYIYHGGSNYNSEFWKQTTAKCSDRIKNDPRFQLYIDAMNAVPMHERSYNRSYGIFAHLSWIDFDKQLGYNYLNSSVESKEW
jgi:hypothetical protein